MSKQISFEKGTEGSFL